MLLLASLCFAGFSFIPSTAFSQAPASPATPAGINGPPAPVPPAMSVRDEQGRITMRAVRIDKPLTLDGRLDEDIYRRTDPVNGFIQQEPHEGEKTTEATDFWVFYDDNNLYLAGRMWDSHLERLQANEMRRDNRNIGAINFTRVGVCMHGAGRAKARAQVVDTNDKKSIGIDRLAGANHVVPPAFTFGLTLVNASHMV